LDALQIVEKWSKNDEFSQYVRALEEWDEIIGESWDGND
jgi:dynein heavy chain, axonemal